MLDTRNQRIAAVVAGVVLVGGVAAAAFIGGGDGSPVAKPPSTLAPTTTVLLPAAPLTGLPGEYGDRLGRPALVVKIDNGEPKARPQAGINQADVVYEERVEGSVTRLLAVFHSTDSEPVGPVRSARTSDIAIVSALHRPFFAWSGANDTFARRIRAADLVDVGFDARTGEYFREPGRSAPSNLMLKSTAVLQALAAEGSSPPQALFLFRDAGTVSAHLEPTAGVRINFGSNGGNAPVEYRWNGEGWARTQAGTPHVDAAGVQVAPANVVIQFVDYVRTDVNDQFGNPIPEASTVGEGEAWILTGGGLSDPGIVIGRWQKTALDSVTTYTDVDGNPILFTPGRTWVALPPPGGASRL